MIIFVGDKVKLGGLCEVVKNRLNDELTFIDSAVDIKKQENDILDIQNVKCIIYDIDQYYNDSQELIGRIKRIYRTNKAKPILLVPTDNPKNEIVKCAVANQLKNFINAAKTLGEQKDEFEKILNGFYESNQREDIIAVEKEIAEDNKTLNEFVGELYDAHQREEKKDSTIIINQKKNSEILLDILKGIFRTVFTIISIVLMSLAIITLAYESSREALFKVLQDIWNQIISIS